MKKITKKNTLIIASLTTVIMLLVVSSEFMKKQAFDDKDYNVKLQIINQAINQDRGKAINFKVKIARNKEEQSKGLMFVKYLPENYGMLFNFEKEQIIIMWMKNTFITLDMLFINDENQIIYIKHKAEPHSTANISSRYPASKVLEINGGLSKKLGIEIGDYLSFLPFKSLTKKETIPLLD